MWSFRETPSNNDYLMHYGIKGQKWGVRRFQNEDRTLTEAGKERYGKNSSSISSEHHKSSDYEIDRHTIKSAGNNKSRSKVDEIADKQDYDRAREFDLVGQTALREYEKHGKEAAQKYLTKALKDIDYDYVINDEKSVTDGQKYLTYGLKVFGNKNLYEVYGETEYSDDQSFSRRS